MPPPDDVTIVDGSVPKYVQLRERLAATARSMAPGQALPSERSLMERYGVSRATVRKAIDALEVDGVVSRAAGKGTFVSTDRVLSTLHLASFTEDMRRRGHEPSTRVLSVERSRPEGAARAHLGDAPAWHVRRLRLADASTMALEDSWWSCEAAPDLDQHDLTGSLYTLVGRHHGVSVERAEQTVWAENAAAATAPPLQVPAGAALLVFERRSWSGRRPVEFTTSWYRGDRYAVHINLDPGMPEHAT
ncbi:GntR family transcriptional regulator [Kocuria flava]|uniref:GntR family transcriptional regulator n=1 Tax=Kocuria flava TaxID=446860 RepID=UPI002F9376C7